MGNSRTRRMYESSGTVRVKLSDSGLKSVFFVPDAAHSVTHGKKDYAVFVASQSQGPARDAMLRGLDKPIKLKVGRESSKFGEGLLTAARASKNVTVGVKVTLKDGKRKKKKRPLKLVSVEVPAPD